MYSNDDWPGQNIVQMDDDDRWQLAVFVVAKAQQCLIT